MNGGVKFFGRGFCLVPQQAVEKHRAGVHVQRTRLEVPRDLIECPVLFRGKVRKLLFRGDNAAFGDQDGKGAVHHTVGRLFHHARFVGHVRGKINIGRIEILEDGKGLSRSVRNVGIVSGNVQNRFSVIAQVAGFQHTKLTGRRKELIGELAVPEHFKNIKIQLSANRVKQLVPVNDPVGKLRVKNVRLWLGEMEPVRERKNFGVGRGR